MKNEGTFKELSSAEIYNEDKIIQKYPAGILFDFCCCISQDKFYLKKHTYLHMRVYQHLNLTFFKNKFWYMYWFLKNPFERQQFQADQAALNRLTVIWK